MEISVISVPTKNYDTKNLFYSTGIPVCILVLKRCKREDDVLFINASEHFEKGKRQNSLSDNNIKSIVDTYKYRKETERYFRRVSIEETSNCFRRSLLGGSTEEDLRQYPL